MTVSVSRDCDPFIRFLEIKIDFLFFMEVTRTLFLLFHRTASMEQQVKKYLLSKMMMMIIITVIIMMTMLIMIIK